MTLEEELLDFAKYNDQRDASICRRAAERVSELEAENARLRKAIESYGNNPAGFDWAVLGRIDELERENERLREADLLVRQIHSDADTGQLDGVDLDWMVAADAYVLGNAKENA